MKIHGFSLCLGLARAAACPVALILPLAAGAGVARAQDGPRIVFPQADQDVRGEISARFEGIPAGGYAVVKVNGQFKSAVAGNSFLLDTLADTSTFNGDGPYTIEITGINSAGRAVGSSSVKFNVANQKVAGGAEATRLVHWMPLDRLNDGVQRYRVFAESNADIISPETAGAGGAGEAGAGAGGGAGGEESYLPAPLDWQVAVLLRREVRDVGLFERAANIATVVSEASQRQREGAGGETGGGEAGAAGGKAKTSAPKKPAGGRRKKGAVAAAPTKGPWTVDWEQGPEFAKFYVKMIQQTGDEINATRKANTIAIADLLPTFPKVDVRPGSTWSSRQSILSDLSTRQPINIEGAITFTQYENIQTPDGVSRRCAKIESRFPLPDGVAKRIAADLGNKVGTGTGAGGGAAAPAGGGAAGEEAAEDTKLLPEDIEVANFNMARVIWFDMDKHQVVRSEDRLTAYFEVPPAEGEAAGGAAAGAGGEAAAAEPIQVNYRMNVTTWLDDRIPAPSLKYTGGTGGPHSRDNAEEPGLARAKGR